MHLIKPLGNARCKGQQHQQRVANALKGGLTEAIGPLGTNARFFQHKYFQPRCGHNNPAFIFGHGYRVVCLSMKTLWASFLRTWHYLIRPKDTMCNYSSLAKNWLQFSWPTFDNEGKLRSILCTPNAHHLSGNEQQQCLKPYLKYCVSWPRVMLTW